MVEMENITMMFESAKEMVEKLGKAFNELKSQRNSYPENKTTWENIKDYFHNLETSIERKLTEVKDMEMELEEKQSATRELVGVREAAVVAKELALLDRLQELKDNAFSTIVEAHKNCRASTPGLEDIDDPAEPLDGDVKVLPKLEELCERMDAKGLLNFLRENKKSLDTITNELSLALRNANEPTRLVLDSLEGFYPPDLSNIQGSDRAALQLLRRSCLVVMEAAAPLLEEAGSVTSEIKQQAEAVAEQWKAQLAAMDIDAINGYSLEVVAFLQLLVTFRIAEGFDEDELYKLCLAVSRHREAPDICRSLGLTEKMRGFIETLVNTGRPIDAVHFGQAFHLTESFPPVPLLKEYLVKSIGRAEPESGQTDSVKREIRILRVVIKCIEDYKLQKHYPVEPLKKRVAQLEKARYNKKRRGQAANSQTKKPRSNGRYDVRKPSAVVDKRHLPRPVYYEKGVNPELAERYPERTTYTTPRTYEVAGHAAQSQQPNCQVPYHYPDERGAPVAAYSSSSNHGGYAGAGLQSSTPSNYENYMGAGSQFIPSNYENYMGAGSQSIPSNYENYTGAGFRSSTPSNYENYAGAAVQSTSSSYYGSYTGTGVQPSHQSGM